LAFELHDLQVGKVGLKSPFILSSVAPPTTEAICDPVCNIEPTSFATCAKPDSAPGDVLAAKRSAEGWRTAKTGDTDAEGRKHVGNRRAYIQDHSRCR
jgi:hypothetical protein